MEKIASVSTIEWKVNDRVRFLWLKDLKFYTAKVVSKTLDGSWRLLHEGGGSKEILYSKHDHKFIASVEIISGQKRKFHSLEPRKRRKVLQFSIKP